MWLYCHAQLLAVTIRVIWLVAFSVEVILPSLVRQTINQRQFELTLREHIIGGWRDLDILTPHKAHHSSRIMRTYHTHFGVPMGNTSGWWDDRNRNQKPVLPLYLRLDIPSNPLGHSQQPQPRTFLPSPFWPQFSGPKNAS